MHIWPVVLGAAVTLAGVLLGAWLNDRREHRKWLRDQRLQASAQFVAAGIQLYRAQGEEANGNENESLRRERLHQLDLSAAVISLLCAPDTRRHSVAFHRIVRNMEIGERESPVAAPKALQLFEEAIRGELK